jgi:ribonuclease HI/exonuclease III
LRFRKHQTAIILPRLAPSEGSTLSYATNNTENINISGLNFTDIGTSSQGIGGGTSSAAGGNPNDEAQGIGGSFSSNPGIEDGRDDIQMNIDPVILDPESASRQSGDRTGTATINEPMDTDLMSEEWTGLHRGDDTEIRTRPSADGPGAGTPLQSRKRHRAAIRIGTLNMKGYWKWKYINQLLRDKNIAVLALQETHMSEGRREEMESLFAKRIRIFSSADVTNPTGRAGIAIVLNTERINAEGVTMEEITPGRAILIHMKWKDQSPLSVLAAYAPNEPTKNQEFTKNLIEHFRGSRNMRQPDIMLGDFNLVEESIDRLPAHSDSEEAVESLKALTRHLNLIDGWRDTNPTQRAYTFRQSRKTATGSQSRIDRIYVKRGLMEYTRDWKIEDSGIPDTDHQIATSLISHRSEVNIGKGRWTMNANVIKNRNLTKFAREKGIETLRSIGQIEARTQEDNPQRFFHQFKKEITAEARRTMKIEIPKLDKSIQRLREELKKTLNNDQLDEQERNLQAHDIQERVQEMEQRRFQDKRSNLATKFRVKGEKLSKFFVRVRKGRRQRDTIRALKKEGSTTDRPLYETDSRVMAEMARKYHSEIQNDTPEESLSPTEREMAVEEATSHIRTRLSAEQRDEMGKLLTEEQVLKAVRLSENDKAAGLDGVIYELYKTLSDRYIEDSRMGRTGFNIILLLTLVFNDIERFGVEPNTEFSDGWMCPIYKKNDKTDIANYRPITLLNTDYKIFTKALTLKLVEVAPALIHPNQAGFMPGRKIVDQTELVQIMTQYAEAYEEDGMIIALDQEKAYDKVAHDYLYRCLEQYGLPDHFIQIVKSIYETAKTRVAVNGFLSKPFEVQRGVRQGDPMSCLLFNLAIEPLAAMLRSSQLEGYRVPGRDERLIVQLFADDTTVFLSERDDIEDLWKMLKQWCKASKAKFNITKTEILPIGSPEFRKTFCEERRARTTDQRIPENVRITPEGGCTRILGSWVGNNVNTENVWKKVTEKIETGVEQWEKSHLSMEARRHMANMTQGGVSQYLARVQGMPPKALETIRKSIRSFIWADKKQAPVREEYLFAPINRGGRKVLDIEARSEAITLVRLKEYLNFSEDRPMWAYFADAIFAKIVPSDEHSDPATRINPFLQTWKTSYGPKSKLPKRLKELVRIAKKYGLRTDAIALTKGLTRKMPVWHHIEATKKVRASKTTRCLTYTHGIKTVGDAETLINTISPLDHRQGRDCTCNMCTEMKGKGCENPHVCVEKAKELLDTIPPRWDPRSTETVEEDENREESDDDEDGWINFNPALVTGGQIGNTLRIFTGKEPKMRGSVRELIRRRDADWEEIAATDGSCENNGHDNAKAGAGIYYGLEDQRNRAIRVPQEMKQSNQTGEMLAIKQLAEEADPERNLRIETDSRYAIAACTTNLRKMEDEGFIGVSNRELIQVAIARLRQRKTQTKVKWIKGHNGHVRNEGADEMARKAIEKTDQDPIDMSIPPNLQLTGAKIAGLSQKLAQKGIREIKEKNLEDRHQTATNIDIIKDDIEEKSAYRPATSTIWTSIRNKDLSPSFRYFAWMAIHDAYMMGQNWLRDNYTQEQKDRAMCQYCGALETMDHVLLRCNEPDREAIWRVAEKLWEEKVGPGTWEEPTLGTILGCALVTFPNLDHKKQKGAERLYRILISETAHMRWRIRCRKRMEGKIVSAEVAERMWTSMIRSRAKLDKRLTNPSFGKEGISRRQLAQTWPYTLLEYIDLVGLGPSSGVLVGIQRDRGGREGVG